MSGCRLFREIRWSGVFAEAHYRLVLTLLACIPSVTVGQAPQVRDSAGVTIVSNPQWTAISPGWGLADRAAIEVGGADADLWQVWSFLRAPDGRIAALSVGTKTVHVFDRSGGEERVLGRASQGPGEFGAPFQLALAPPDTLYVLDGSSVEIFSLDGEYLGSEAIPRRPNLFGPGATPRPNRVAPDRLMIWLGGPPPQIREDEVFRQRLGLGISLGLHEDPRLAAWVSGIEQQNVELPGGRSRIIIPPFSRRSVVGFGPEPDARVFTADNAWPEVRLYGPNGELRRIVRWELSDIRPIREEWIEDWKRGQANSRAPVAIRREIELAWDEMTVPPSLPAFDDVAIDEAGYLWVRAPTPTAGSRLEFGVFDPDGRFVGMVEVPAGLRAGIPPVVGEDYFLGVWTDPFGVESLRLYELGR